MRTATDPSIPIHRLAPDRTVARGRRNAHDHELFRRFPLDGEAILSIGTVPTPYHVYGGYGVFIGGTADLNSVRALLQPEGVAPVLTDKGRALMGVWVFDFTDASLGPHHELQVSIFVTDDELAPVDANRLSLLQLMATRPDVRMLCHGLWNDTARVVAYNRELLALDARHSESTIARDPRTFRFSIDDRNTGAPIVEGYVRDPQRPSLMANLALVSRLGLRRVREFTRQPWIKVPVLNPVGPVLDRNAAADSFTKTDVSVLRYFDSKRDHVTFRDDRYAHLGFEPQFVQFMDGFKFVYLFPR